MEKNLMNEEALENEEFYDDFEDCEDAVDEVVKEPKSNGIVSKAVAGIKKHGKTVAGIAALIAVGAIGYKFGHKAGDGNSSYDHDDIGSNLITEDSACLFEDSSIDSTEE